MICKTPLLHLLSCAVKLAQRPYTNATDYDSMRQEGDIRSCPLLKVSHLKKMLVRLTFDQGTNS